MTRRTRWSASALAIGSVVWIVLVSGIACDRDATTAAGEPEAAHARAAEAGMDWLLEHARAMPPGWGHTSLVHLRRAVGPGPRADRIDAVLGDPERGPAPLALAAELAREDLLEPERLIAVLFEVLRLRAAGGDWEAPRDAVIARIEDADGDPTEAWPLRQRSVRVYLFEALDMPAEGGLDDVVQRLARAAEGRAVDALAAGDRYVYALTHVVLARSRYFERLASPDGLAFAIPVLRRRIEAGLAADADVFTFDLYAESVYALELLGVEEATALSKARDRIVALQNEDGSWGRGEGITPRRIHPTFNAVMALLPLRERLHVGGASH